MHDSPRSNPDRGPVEDAVEAATKPAFEEPRLLFIEPKLTPRRDLRDVTAGFFGSFDP